MRYTGLIAATIAAAVAFATGAAAQDDATRARCEAALDAAMAKYPLKAILIGISEGGEEPWLAARGETMTGVPATPDMRFRNGAVAITYLGTLLLLLAEQGVVAVDDPVAKWFPDYPKADDAPHPACAGDGGVPAVEQGQLLRLRTHGGPRLDLADPVL